MLNSLHLSSPIIPGLSAGGITLGTPAKDIAAITGGIFRPSYFASPNIPGGFVIRHRSPSLELWESDGVIRRIIAQGEYSGLFEETIGIGSTLQELEEAFGEWRASDDGTIVIPEITGISFAAEESYLPDDPESGGIGRIRAIIIG